MEENKKRKSNDSRGNSSSKKPKSPKYIKARQKQWQMPKKNYLASPAIEPGDAGIWATCDMHKEGLCTMELQDFFKEYAISIYGDTIENVREIAQSETGKEDDIEAEINKEVSGIKKSNQSALFVPVKIDIQCVLFFKTRAPIDPVSFVHRVCSDAFEKADVKRSRWARRLTPMTRMGKATEKNLGEVAKAVLGPIFHQEGGPAQKFAIRATIRNNNVMKRDDVIKQVADIVGKQHSVDLKNYDYLVLVDVYRNILGLSVVGNDYEKLKRYNLAEIYDPTPAKSKS